MTKFFRMLLGQSAGGGGVGPGGYTLPAGANDPILWLQRNTGLYTDAGVTPVASDGDLIHQWNDQSGNGYHFVQTTSGNRPKYKTGVTYQGLPVVDFIRADGRYFQPPDALGTALAALSAAEIFIVLKAKSSSVNSGLHNFGTDGVGGSAYVDSGGSITDSFGTATRQNSITPSLSVTSDFRVYNVYSKAGAWAARLDNIVQRGTDVNTYAARTSSLLFGSNSGYSNADMYVADVIIYPYQLSGTNRNAVVDAITAGAVAAADYTNPRFFRIKTTATWASGFLGIASFEARESSGGTDYASTSTPTGSFFIGAPYTFAAAVDGNNSTFWTTGGSTLSGGTNWFMLDFGSTGRNITEVKITVRPDGFREDPKDFAFEASYDGAEWFSLGWSYTSEPAWSAGETRTFTKP